MESIKPTTIRYGDSNTVFARNLPYYNAASADQVIAILITLRKAKKEAGIVNELDLFKHKDKLPVISIDAGGIGMTPRTLETKIRNGLLYIVENADADGSWATLRQQIVIKKTDVGVVITWKILTSKEMQSRYASIARKGYTDLPPEDHVTVTVGALNDEEFFNAVCAWVENPTERLELCTSCINDATKERVKNLLGDIVHVFKADTLVAVQNL